MRFQNIYHDKRPHKSENILENKYISTNTDKLVHLQTTYLQPSYVHY